MSTPVEYASVATDPREAARTRWLYRLVLVCGILPLVVGASILLAFWWTRWDVWATAGMLTILAGLALFLVGVALLMAYTWRELRVVRTPGDIVAWRAGIAVLILLANFPIAFGCMAGAMYLVSLVEVRLHNASGAAIDSCVLTVPGAWRDFGPLADGKSRRISLQPVADGEGVLTVGQGGRTASAAVAPYIGKGSGGRADVTVEPGPVLRVRLLR